MWRVHNATLTELCTHRPSRPAFPSPWPPPICSPTALACSGTLHASEATRRACPSSSPRAVLWRPVHAEARVGVPPHGRVTSPRVESCELSLGAPMRACLPSWGLPGSASPGRRDEGARHRPGGRQPTAPSRGWDVTEGRGQDLAQHPALGFALPTVPDWLPTKVSGTREGPRPGTAAGPGFVMAALA